MKLVVECIAYGLIVFIIVWGIIDIIEGANKSKQSWDEKDED